MTLGTLGNLGNFDSQDHRPQKASNGSTLGTLGKNQKTPQSFSVPAPSLRIPRAGEIGPWERYREEFMEYLRVGGFSENTVDIYQRGMGRFGLWLLGRGVRTPMGVTPDLCMSYQRAVFYHVSRRGVPNPVNNQRNMLTGVRKFLRFLKKRGHALIDPGQAIEMPKAPQRLPREVLGEEEIAALLRLPDTATLRGYRDRTILEVLYATGMRSGELLGLDVEDINLEAERVHIRQGKGKKDRVVPLGEVATEFLSGYLRSVRPRFLRGEGERAVFMGMEGKRLYSEVMALDIRRYAKRGGISKRVNPHAFRHACATHMLKRGANIRHIQEILGHATVRTTEIYTHVEIGDLRKIHEEFHPRGSL